MTAFLLPDAPVRSLDGYLATDWGGLGLARATELGPEATIAELDRSGLRGRGGAGFPTGRKWSGVRAQPETRRYVVANGAEGEPGTFKDRTLLRTNPYQVVEGVIIAGQAIGALGAYICLKASFTAEVAAVTEAVQEMQAAGICRDCSVTIVEGPEDYLFGEEKAMLEVIEGNAPLPRLLPPYEHGLFGFPTLVNNVETLANVPVILARGADWFRAMGSQESPGNVICTVVGDVVNPGVAEVELGTPLREVIQSIGGGPRPGRSIKAVLPGVASGVVSGDQLDVPLTYEGFSGIESGMGSAGFIVVDDSACMVEVAHRCSGFLSVESCGQCSPCKLGSEEITTILRRIQRGIAEVEELDEMIAWLTKVTDGSRCYLAAEEQVLVSSILRAFPDEFDEHLATGRCPRPRPFVVPKLTDL